MRQRARAALALATAASVGCNGRRDAARDTAGAPTSASDSKASAARDSAVAPATVLPSGGDFVPHEVNRGGTHGMASQVRWVFSPDRTRVLVVEDPAAVENEPIADGWLYAAESGAPAVITGERSWDVAPSPDWTRVAAGVGFFASARERDSLFTTQWDSLARVSGLPVAEARRSSFHASGMAIAEAVARTAVWRLDREAPPARAPFGGGWRVGWTTDGRLLVGTGPSRAQEDATSSSWIVADAVTFAVRDTVQGGAPSVGVRWEQGPTIDIGVALDLRAARTIPVSGGTVESRDGAIRVCIAGACRPVGAGLALAASRSGRLVVAVAPDRSPRGQEAPVQVVVYRLQP